MSDKQLQHIAIIMDGNGRWAKQRFLPRVAGHKAGIDNARKIIQATIQLKIPVLTLFVFSSENWRRPPDEVKYILTLFLHALKSDIKKLHENGVKLQIIGDTRRFSTEIQQAIIDAEKLTANNTKLHLILAANYGGQWDIEQALQQIAQKVQNKELQIEDINADLVQKNLVTKDIPAPDLFIRTSGEQRISNFYLWQLAYSELYFTDIFWPDFNEQELTKAIEYYQQRERRYGYISEQIKAQHNA